MKIALGTVQFGMDYGITNKQGRTSKNEVKEILAYANKNGINILDTAPGYGDAEKVLGCFHNNEFEIITKTPHFNNPELTKKDIQFLTDTFNLSLKNLNVSKVYGLMIHNVLDCYKSGSDNLFSTLYRLKKEGVVQKVGVSVYTPEDIEMLLNNFSFDIIQFPLNILDQRILEKGLIQELKSRDIEIYVRSAFLQGLLLESIEKIPKKYIEYVTPYFNEIESQGLTKVESVLLFLNKIKEIDYVVLGVNNLSQLKRNMEAYNKIQHLEHIRIDFSKYAVNELDIIDPRRW